MKKQDLLDQMAAEQLQDEEVLAIVNKYPDEMDDESVSKLEAELEDFATDNELLAKAYQELNTDLDNQMDMAEMEVDTAIKQAAQTAYNDLSWAMEQSDQQE